MPCSFYCCITQEVMRDPVSTVDGHVYERRAIVEWFRRFRRGTAPRSPKTGLPLPSLVLTPNIALRHAIEEYVKLRPYLERRMLDGASMERAAQELEADLEAKACRSESCEDPLPAIAEAAVEAARAAEANAQAAAQNEASAASRLLAALRWAEDCAQRESLRAGHNMQRIEVAEAAEAAALTLLCEAEASRLDACQELAQHAEAREQAAQLVESRTQDLALAEGEVVQLREALGVAQVSGTHALEEAARVAYTAQAEVAQLSLARDEATLLADTRTRDLTLIAVEVAQLREALCGAQVSAGELAHERDQATGLADARSEDLALAAGEFAQLQEAMRSANSGAEVAEARFREEVAQIASSTQVDAEHAAELRNARDEAVSSLADAAAAHAGLEAAVDAAVTAAVREAQKREHAGQHRIHENAAAAIASSEMRAADERATEATLWRSEVDRVEASAYERVRVAIAHAEKAKAAAEAAVQDAEASAAQRIAAFETHAAAVVRDTRLAEHRAEALETNALAAEGRIREEQFEIVQRVGRTEAAARSAEAAAVNCVTAANFWAAEAREEASACLQKADQEAARALALERWAAAEVRNANARADASELATVAAEARSAVAERGAAAVQRAEAALAAETRAIAACQRVEAAREGELTEVEERPLGEAQGASGSSRRCQSLPVRAYSSVPRDGSFALTTRRRTTATGVAFGTPERKPSVARRCPRTAAVAPRTPERRTPEKVEARRQRGVGAACSAGSPAPQRTPLRNITNRLDASLQPSLDARALGVSSAPATSHILLEALRGRRPLGGWAQFGRMLTPLLTSSSLELPHWRQRVPFCTEGLREAYSEARMMLLAAEYPEVFCIERPNALDEQHGLVALRSPPLGGHLFLCPLHDLSTGCITANPCAAGAAACLCAYLTCAALLREEEGQATKAAACMAPPRASPPPHMLHVYAGAPRFSPPPRAPPLP